MRRRATLWAALAATTLALTVLAPTSARALDPGPWDEVLQAHAKRGGFDYAAFSADDAAKAKLDRFLAGVATMPAGAGLADWLNAYNALVVKSVADRYPIRSVKDVPGFFDRVRHRVAGAARTLDAIENQVIRPRFGDARVHFALNCGANGCPALHGRAFRAGNLDAVLDRLARRSVRSRSHVRRNDAGKFEVSAIFFWFRDDFVASAGSVSAWIKRYGGDAVGDLTSDDQLVERRYNWRLNDRS